MASLIPWRSKRQNGREMERSQPPSAPKQALARLHDEFETLFDQLFNGLPAVLDDDAVGQLRVPTVEEQENEIVVRAEAPGFDPEDIDVELNGRVLTITAESGESHEDEEGDEVQQSYRVFVEEVVLPDYIKADDIEANFHNGLLEIHVPKSEAAKPKRIALKSS